MLKQEQCATIKNDDSVKVSTINYRVKNTCNFTHDVSGAQHLAIYS